MGACDVTKQPQLCCRICLGEKATKDIALLSSINRKNPGDILLFCLDIQIDENSKSRKLCLKCFKKINDFYQFKTLAQKNHLYLQSLELIKEESFKVSDNKIDISFENETCIEAVENVKKECNEYEITFETLPNVTYEYVEDSNHNDDVEPDTVEFDYNSLPLSLPKSIKQIKRKRNLKTKQERKDKPVKRRKKEKKNAENKLEVCPKCGKQVRNLSDHTVVHFPRDQRKIYKCSLCEKVYKTRSALYVHIRTYHMEKGRVNCNICGVVICLKQHMKNVHGNRPFQCVICNKKFLNQNNLNTHIKKHTGEKSHQCNVCGEKYSTNRMLSFHERRVHQKERSFTCDYCSKSFFKKESLVNHIRIHTGDRPYKCPDCKKTFMSTSTLKDHRLTHGENKYHCTECSKTFSNSKRLNTHLVTHTRERKYPCRHCGVGFLRSDHRNRHELTAHLKQALP